MHTERLFIRPFTLDDAAAFLPLVSDPEVIRYTGDEAATSVDGAREILATRPLRDYAVHGFGRMACIEKSSGRLVGFTGLKFLEDLGEVDIGYRFLPDCWGKGYATESARPLMAYGIGELGLERIIGLVIRENLASAHVLRKLGLSFEREACLDGVALDIYATAGSSRLASHRPIPR